MITKKNLKVLLETLGFSSSDGNEYSKPYCGLLDCRIVVDFTKETITWPVKLRRGDETASNFSAPENFVVLECVDRLLEKPHLAIQKKIIAECAKVDKECAAQKKTVADMRMKIIGLIDAVDSATPRKGWYVGIVDDILQSVIGQGSKVASKDVKKKGAIPVVSQEDGPIISGYVDEGTPITDLPVVVFGDHSCTFKYVDFPFVRGADGTQLLKFDSTQFDAKFMCCYLRSKKLSNENSYERHMKYLKALSIAVPPLAEQHTIATKIVKCEETIAKAEAQIAKVAVKKSAILKMYL